MLAGLPQFDRITLAEHSIAGHLAQDGNLKRLLPTLRFFNLPSGVFKLSKIANRKPDAKGGCSDIFKVDLEPRRHNDVPVAVKRFRIHMFGDMIKDAISKVRIFEYSALQLSDDMILNLYDLRLFFGSSVFGPS